MKQKKVLTRKQRALRRVVVAVALMLALSYMYHSFYLLPVQALHDSYERYGVQEPKVVLRQDAAVLGDDGTYYLSSGKEAGHLTRLRYEPILGWVSQGTRVLDCGDGGGVHARWEREGGPLLLWGRVDSREVCRIVCSVEEAPEFLVSMETPFTAVYTVEEFIPEGDARYFYSVFDWEGNCWTTECYITMTAYDEAGNVVAEEDLTRFP